MTLDDVSDLLSWDVSWSALSGPATAMHCHGPAPAGVNAGVQVNIGAISGLTSPSIDSATITASQANDLLAGLWYIDIHTATYPGGDSWPGTACPRPRSGVALRFRAAWLARDT